MTIAASVISDHINETIEALDEFLKSLETSREYIRNADALGELSKEMALGKLETEVEAVFAQQWKQQRIALIESQMWVSLDRDK